MLSAIGRFLQLAAGFFFLALLASILGALLLGSLWLDAAGVEEEAEVVEKHEDITFSNASWWRTLEIGLSRQNGPYAEMRRAIKRKEPGKLLTIGTERVRVSSAVYDQCSVGQRVKVRVQPPGFFRDWPIFTPVRLSGQTTFSRLPAFYESAWPVPDFLLTLLPAALLGWLARKTNRRVWFLSGICAAVAIGYWLSPLSDRRPAGDLRQTEGKVVALRLIEEIGATADSSGVDALTPHLIVGVEFLPTGFRDPVVAVDRV
ncbi:MAG: hypothetical protein K2X03_16480, partial [Bryobacteraceae bacterium]|nr:hypothetical protein [Bryobacteraceae bacterium]